MSICGPGFKIGVYIEIQKWMKEIQATNFFWAWAVEQIPGHPAADSSQPPCCHSGQDEVVEDDEDEHGGDDGGGERVDQLVVQLQVQIQVDG